VGVSHILEETCLGEWLEGGERENLGTVIMTVYVCKPLWMSLRFGVQDS